MRAKIFIRFDAASPDEASWLRLDEPARRELVVQRGSWQEAAAAAAGCRAVALAPGTEVLLTVAAVPAGNRRQVANAIPFALEEQVASDVEETHFAAGERREDGRINTAVVLKERMDGWLERLRGHGIEPDAIVPEPLALPWSADAWTVLCEGGKALVRNGRQSGFAADADNLATLLHLALNEAGEARPERLRVMRGADDPSPRPDLSALELEITEEIVEEPALAVLARGYDEQTAIDLLQGPYSRREQLGRLWRPWRPAAALAAAWLLVLGGMTVADYARLDGENKALTQDIEKTYLQAFPEARKVVNARVQMEEHLKELRGGGPGGEDFLGLLASIGPRLKETPGAELQRISYNEGNVDIALLIADLQSLDQLKQRLAAQAGLSVDIQSAASRDGRVEALLQIKGKNLMKDWLENLEPRERNALMIGVAALVVMLVYFLGWQPFSARVERLEQSVQEQRALKQWIAGAAQEAQRLRATRASASPAGMGGQSLLAVVDQSAKRDRLGAALKRIEPEGATIVRVWFEQAVFDDVLLWLGELRNSYGVRVASVSIDRQGSAGLVNARVELEGGG